jgi:hypothetical protein
MGCSDHIGSIPGNNLYWTEADWRAAACTLLRLQARVEKGSLAAGADGPATAISAPSYRASCLLI